MLLLLVVELAELGPAHLRDDVARAQFAIWAVFVIAFIVELAAAPSKREYLLNHWLVLLSLIFPLFRAFRVVRAVRFLRAHRALRALTLGRVLGATNRVRRVLAEFSAVSQFGYLVALTVLVTITAAGGALYFERNDPDAQLRNFGDALWWASTLVTTVNAQIEVHSAEARVLSLLLRVYGVSIIGYLTARLAAFFLGARADDEPEPRERGDLDDIRDELREVRRLLEGNPDPQGGMPRSRKERAGRP